MDTGRAAEPMGYGGGGSSPGYRDSACICCATCCCTSKELLTTIGWEFLATGEVPRVTEGGMEDTP